MGSDLQRVSISKAGLLLSGCTAWANPASAWYDESRRPPEDTQKRDDGICFHEHVAKQKDGDGPREWNRPSFDLINRWLEHAYNYLSSDLLLRCESYETEVAVAINWKTGEARLLGGVANRNYPSLGSDWQYGTADIVAVLSTGELLIADWKTGGSDGAEEQLLTLAVALQKLYGGKKVRISCLRVDEEGVWPHERPVPQQELYNHGDAMAFAWEDIGKKYDPRPGSQCTVLYCPHLAYCSAIDSAVRDAASGPESAGAPLVPVESLLKKITDTPTTDQEAGDQMALASAAKRQINYLIEGAKKYVRSGGRVISGQFEWKDRGNGFRWGRR